MAGTYSNNTTNTSIVTGNKFVAGRPPFGLDTYTTTRGFTKFDLSGSGLVLADIEKVELLIYVSSVAGGSGTYRLRSETGAGGWGATLDATQADYQSTSANVEASDTISATGWHTFTVDKNNLDLNNINYYRTTVSVEGTTTGKTINYNSQDNASNKPILRITMVGGRIRDFSRFRRGPVRR